MNKITVNRTL